MAAWARRLLLMATALVAVLACSGASAWANAGEPDPSFGKDGLAIAPVRQFYLYPFPRAIAVDGKGRIVIAGYWAHMVTAQPVVARFEPDGTLDSSFGENGIVALRWGLSYSWSYSDGVAIDSAGRIVLGGTVARGSFNYDFAVGRLLEDGSPDPSFGNDGLLTIDSGSEGDSGTALAIDGEGRILLGGTTERLRETERAVAIRVTPDGSLDPSFGAGGIATVGFGERSSAEAIAVEPSGAVLLAGGATVSGSRRFALYRLNSNGNPDPSLGGDGHVTFDPPGARGEKAATAVAVDASGRLLLVGTEGSEGNEAAPVVRLLPNGFLDPSFGTGGALVLPLSQPAVASGAALDSKGRLVIVGGAGTGNEQEPFLARLDSNGAMDTSFGQNGLVLDGRLRSYYSGARAVAIDSAGRYLIAAGVREGFVVARYLPESQAAPAKRYRCRGKKATIVGTPRRDVLKGTKGRDVIVGLRGNDVIRGRGGNDLICGGVGRDRLFGGRGRDKLFGGKGGDLLVGGPGRDRLHGGPGRDVQR